MIAINKNKKDINSYQLNTAYKIKVVFQNNLGGYDPDNIAVEVTSPGGIVTTPNVIKANTGFYYCEVTFNEIGNWSFSWSSDLNGVQENISYQLESKNFNDAHKFNLELNLNQLIVVEIDSGIKNSDESLTLLSDSRFSFSTEYSPFYCSVRMLRMEMGEWASLVPDDTIALSIHWSSMEADSITSKGTTSEEYYYARTRFVMYDAAIKLFSMPMGAEGKSGQSKQLGDLIIENGNVLDYAIRDLVQELKEERDEWWRVVNARGSIVLGQGLGPSTATKGGKNEIKRSREWHDPWNEHYTQPTQNSQYRRKGQSKHRHGFTGWNEHYYTSVKKGVRNKR
jgi:hypothetical protein